MISIDYAPAVSNPNRAVAVKRYTVIDHLLDRLTQIGVTHTFGVPGDYSLRMLDHIVSHPALDWVGCTNELNAGYAADGYARMRGAAALFTTYGVGELSAINAIAGSFAEHVPVIHVVGAPTLASQSLQRALHHTLGDGKFDHFLHMHAPITAAAAALDRSNAVTEIDRVLTAVVDQHLPGYLLVPADVAELEVPSVGDALPRRKDTTDPDALDAFTDAAARLLLQAGGDVAVLVGLLVHRLGAGDELRRLIDGGQLSHATTLWAKSLIDETGSGFRGTYAGAASLELTRRTIEEAGVTVLAGVQFTDLNSGIFTQRIDRRRTIDLGATSASVGAATFSPVELSTALSVLAHLVPQQADHAQAPRNPVELPAPPVCTDADGALDQHTLWSEVAAFLRPGDVVVADQGTAFYGMAPHRLPAGVTFVGQPLWASIGYALPATLGACLASPNRRGVLLIGDGAAQMTVQELSTLLRANLPVVVIVVDNDGYTVERAIHGADQPYNDIAHWDWTQAPHLFGSTAKTVRATTKAELRGALEQAATQPGQPLLLQAVVPRNDVPDLLDRLTTILADNARLGTTQEQASDRSF